MKDHLKFAARTGNNPQYIGGRSLLLERLVALAGQPGNIRFLAGCGDGDRLCPLAQTSCGVAFNCLSPVLERRLIAPPRLGEAIVSTQSSISKGVGCETTNVR